MNKENLWAPWRMAYIRENMKKGGAEKKDGCFLCEYSRHPEQDEENYVVHRTNISLVVLNRFPYNNGHLLIAPLEHRASLTDLNEEQLLDLQKLITSSMKFLQQEMKCDGFNVGLNQGDLAGAGLPGHLHWHVVPRWKGDANFMDVVADVHVIPDSLREVHKILTSCFK